MPVVDGLRGIAILSVLTFHIAPITSGGSLWETFYRNAAGLGWAGVDLFFVLSGFLITGILYSNRKKAQRYYSVFYFRRAVRIFPLYYASLVLLLGMTPLVYRLMHIQSTDLRQPSSQGLAWVFLLNWRMGFLTFTAVPAYLHQFWSLSIEEQFYLVWPFVVRKLSRQHILFVCGVMVVTSLALRIVFYLNDMSAAGYVFTFCRLDSLALGALVALSIRDDDTWKIVVKGAPAAASLAACGLMVLMAFTRSVYFEEFWMGTIGINLWAVLFAGSLVVALSSQPGSFIHRTGSSRFLGFFGKYSYGLYVWHQPVNLILGRAGINSDHMTEALHSKVLAVVSVNGIILTASVVVAYLSWHLLEKQFLKLKELPAMRYAALPNNLGATCIASPPIVRNESTL